jgi:hypothetical protein
LFPSDEENDEDKQLLFLTVTPEIDEMEEAKPTDQIVQNQKIKKAKPIDG